MAAAHVPGAAHVPFLLVTTIRVQPGVIRATRGAIRVAVHVIRAIREAIRVAVHVIIELIRAITKGRLETELTQRWRVSAQ